MTRKKKVRMNFQSATKLVSDSIDGADVQVGSLVEACEKCGFLEGHTVRTRHQLPNPRRLSHRTISDVIDLNDRQVRAVAMALFEKGLKTVGDLLDKKPSEIFDDLKVSERQKLDFAIAIENAGVRFVPASSDNSTAQT